METAKGVVKALSKYGKGFALEGIDGWFTAYKDADVENAVVGASVEFKYKTKANPNGADYMNIQGSVNVVSAPAPTSSGAAKGGGYGAGPKQFRSVEELNRIDGVNMAIAAQSAGALTLPTDNKAALVALLQIASGITAYIDGRFVLGATAAAEAQVEPEPEPEPEPAPEPEPVQTSSSLGDFMNG